MGQKWVKGRRQELQDGGSGGRETGESDMGPGVEPPRTRWSQMWQTPSLFLAQPVTLGGGGRENKDLEVSACYFTCTCQQSPLPLTLQTLSRESLLGPVWVQQKENAAQKTTSVSHIHFGHCTRTHVHLLQVFPWDSTTWGSSVTKACWLWTGKTGRQHGRGWMSYSRSLAPNGTCTSSTVVAWATDFTSQSPHFFNR